MNCHIDKINIFVVLYLIDISNLKGVMKMRKYFKFVGYVGLVIWLISFIALIVQYTSVARVITTEIGNQTITTGGLNAEGHFYYITSLLSSLIFGPSLSLLFIHVGKLEDRVLDTINHATKDSLKFIKLNADRGITFFDSYFRVNNRIIRYNITDLDKTDTYITFMNGNTKYQLYFYDFERTEEFYNKLKEIISR